MSKLVLRPGFDNVEQCLMDLVDSALAGKSPVGANFPGVSTGIRNIGQSPLKVLPYPPLPVTKSGKNKRITEKLFQRIIDLRASIDTVNAQAKTDYDGNNWHFTYYAKGVPGSGIFGEKVIEYRRLALSEVLGKDKVWTITVHHTGAWNDWHQLSQAILAEVAKSHRIVISELVVEGPDDKNVGWVPKHHFEDIEMVIRPRFGEGSDWSPIYAPGSFAQINVNWRPEV